MEKNECLKDVGKRESVGYGGDGIWGTKEQMKMKALS